MSELPAIDGLSAVPFRKDDLIVVLQPSHPLASRESLTFAQIAELPFVGLHADSSLHHLLTRAAVEAGVVLNWRMHVTSFDAACAMVAAGLGVSVVPKAAATPYIKALALTAIPLTESWAARQLFLCTRAGADLHSAARVLLEHLRNG